MYSACASVLFVQIILGVIIIIKINILHGEFWIWSNGEKKKMTMVHTRLGLPKVFADGCALGGAS